MVGDRTRAVLAHVGEGRGCTPLDGHLIVHRQLLMVGVGLVLVLVLILGTVVVSREPSDRGGGGGPSRMKTGDEDTPSSNLPRPASPNLMRRTTGREAGVEGSRAQIVDVQAGAPNTRLPPPRDSSPIVGLEDHTSEEEEYPQSRLSPPPGGGKGTTDQRGRRHTARVPVQIRDAPGDDCQVPTKVRTADCTAGGRGQ